MAHRRPVLAECARILVLEGGRMQMFGPSAKVLPRIPGYRRPQLSAVGERRALAGAGDGRADPDADGD